MIAEVYIYIFYIHPLHEKHATGDCIERHSKNIKNAYLSSYTQYQTSWVNQTLNFFF